MGNKANKEKRPNKAVALITYIIALIALLLGLFLPFGNMSGVEGTDAIWAFQIPQAINAIVPIEALNGVGPALTYSFKITLNGWIEGGFDLGALFTVLYALVALAGIIALFPAIVSAFSKKSKKNTALKAASFIEVVAFLFTSVFLFIQLTKFSAGILFVNASDYQWSWAMVAALGGTLLMLVFQNIFYRKGSGLLKFILFILSALVLLVGIYDLAVLIPELKEPLAQMTGDLGSGVYSQIIGIFPILMFFCGGKNDMFIAMPTLTEYIAEMDTLNAMLVILTFALAMVALINFLLDAMGMGKNTKKFMLVSNVIRFTFELLLAGAIIILSLVTEGQSIGIMGIVIAIIAAAELIINIFRLVAINAKRKKINKAVQQEKERAVEMQNAPVSAKPETANPELYAEPVIFHEEEEPVAPVADETQTVYSPIIYNGPMDEFIRTLSTEQKVEFSKVFLERQCGNLNFIPDYAVSGSNDKFFTSIFIYFARLRNLVSDGLLNKMYEYKNLMD